MITLKTDKKRLVFLTALIYASSWAGAGESIGFSTGVLNANNRQNVDLQCFSEGNSVTLGGYLLDVRINNQEIPQQSIRYIVDPVNPHESVACLMLQQLGSLVLKEETLTYIYLISATCYDISHPPDVALNNSAGVLDTTVPQAWMRYTNPDWTPSERWSNGVVGLIFDYSASDQATHYRQSGDHYRSLSGYGQTGFDLGIRHSRGQYQANYASDENRGRTDWDQIYTYRPLPMQAAKLTVGEMYLSSQAFGSVRLTEADLTSNERMLPPNLQGYTPEVHGIVRSNAKVTISQQGRVIYRTTVPAGPSNIQDLHGSVRGTLGVRVEGQDGSIQAFQVNTADIPYLTRPGYVRYDIAAGKPSRYNHDVQGSAFYSGDFSWGASNMRSLYGGVLPTSNRYGAWSMGVGRDLGWLGVLSANMAQSVSRVKHQAEQKGMSFKLSRAKTFDEYNSTTIFAGYRFSQRSFCTFSQFLDEQYENNNSVGNEKEIYTIAGNKAFFADDPQLATMPYLTYTHRNYWGRGPQDRYGMSMGHGLSSVGIQGTNTNLATCRSEYQGKWDDSLSPSISVPWSNSRSMDYDIQSSSSQTSQMVSYSDNHGRSNPWRLRAEVFGEGHTALDGCYKRRNMVTELESNVSWQQSHHFSVGDMMYGGSTATRHGVALHNSQTSMNTTRVMVDTDGVTNVPLDSEQTHSNCFGIVVVPDVVSCHSFDTCVDMDAMDESISTTGAIVTNTLTGGMIGYQCFAVAQGQKMMALPRLKDGSVPPFGAEALNANGASVAVVMENGMARIAGVNPTERLFVVWGGHTQCHLQVPQQVNPEGNVPLPCEQYQ